MSEDVARESLRNSFACSSSTLERFLRKVEKAYLGAVSLANGHHGAFCVPLLKIRFV